jgi:hypothetical protein
MSKGSSIFKVLKEKEYLSKCLCLAQLSFKTKGEAKVFPEKQN